MTTFSGPDIDAVTRLIETVSHEEVLPRFRRLQAGDVERKISPGDPEDVVTIVDRNVERRLTDGFSALFPSTVVIGEEAAHEHPEILSLLDSDSPVWIIDPIDGTKNFARGDEGFGIIVCLVSSGHAQAAWIHLPVLGQTFVAEAGSGTFLNGERVSVPSLSLKEPPRGTFFIRYMPSALREAVVQAAEGQFRAKPDSGCAAIEYTTILKGDNEFAIYYRLLPWDHAAPALILSEAGGRVEHLDGHPYSVRSKDQVTIVARDATVCARVRNFLR